MVDTLIFYGRGAGKLPTASAVVADIIDAALDCGYNEKYSWVKGSESDKMPYEDVRARFFIRIKKEQREAACAEFGNVDIIKGVSDYGFVAPKMSVGELESHIEKIGGAVSKMRLFR